MKLEKKFFMSLLLVSSAISSFSQDKPIATIDVLKGKQLYEKEVMYFYEQNWKVYREEALKQKHISFYELIKTKADSTGFFSVILITQYPDSIRFNQREENFRPIMKKFSPNGPKMLNQVKRSDFIESGKNYNGEVVFKNP